MRISKKKCVYLTWSLISFEFYWSEISSVNMVIQYGRVDCQEASQKFAHGSMATAGATL